LKLAGRAAAPDLDAGIRALLSYGSALFGVEAGFNAVGVCRAEFNGGGSGGTACFEECRQIPLCGEVVCNKAKLELEEILKGPSKELADRARMHLKIAEQRMKPSAELNPRTAEEHYQRGVGMMNIGRWDDARESLLKARKAAPKADHIHYALAALDCLTGEADSAMANLKVAIQLRAENRYHARNDEDFAFLQEDPRFTELLYPEKDGMAGQ
jgi:tetratricopeptide (TPR) repeat protein